VHAVQKAAHVSASETGHLDRFGGSVTHANRIPQSTGFTGLLSQRPLCRTRRLQCFRTISEQPGSRLGVLVPKRWARRAVDRHAFKRLVRQAHLQWRKQTGLNEDLLIRLVSPIKSMGLSDREQWWNELQQLFNSIQERT